MAVEVRVPAAGESITEVLIAEWLKAEGDTIRVDEPLVTLETDKATLDLPAPASGVLARIVTPVGQVARVGQVIAILEEVAAGTRPSAGAAPPTARHEPGAAPADRPRRSGGAARRDDEPRAAPRGGSETARGRAPARARGDGAPAEAAEDADGDIVAPGAPRVMPAAQRLLEEHGLAPDAVTATGPGGRLLKEDVLRHLEARDAEIAGEPGRDDVRAGDPGPAPGAGAARRSSAAPPAPAMPARGAMDGTREEEAVPMTMLRRRIAERLVQAQQAAALLTTFNEIDMSAVIALRKAHQDAFQQRHEVKLGFMSFFVRGVIEGLKLIPALNAEIRGTDIVYRHYYDIGIAVGGGRGLVVPVLRNGQQLSFAETERAITDFARRAAANQLTLEELQGGTFTISNGGIYGSLLSTPIVNPPQSGILGLHAIQDRPVARDGQVVIRPMMYVALTYDHRLVDGREAVTFLRHVKACLEDPTRILLEI